MTLSLYPCLQCGRLIVNQDKYVICERCLKRFDERCSGRELILPRIAEEASEMPLSDEANERLRRLLDDW
jgi:hypothetical protein